MTPMDADVRRAHWKKGQDGRFAKQEAPPTKVCTQCKRDLPRSAYTRLRDGIKPYCRECDRVLSRERYARKPHHRGGGEHRYDQDDPRKKARALLMSAVRYGKMERKPCEVCGNPKSHGHHDDYAKPLDVRWLCSRHHAEAHRKPVAPECLIAAGIRRGA